MAARDHVKDTGLAGIMGHIGADGSKPEERIKRYSNKRIAGESCTYGA